MTLVVIGAALMIAACSNGSPSQDGSVDSEAPRSIVSAVEIVERYGPDAAIDAVLLAFERGYLVEQIQTAAVAGDLNQDGTLVDEPPSGPRLDLIIIPAEAGGEAMAVIAVRAAVRVQSTATEPRRLEGVRRGIYAIGELSDVWQDKESTREFYALWKDDPDSAEGVGAAGIAFIFALTEIGYSMDQVIESIILGYEVGYRVVGDEDAETKCPTLFFADERMILPNDAKGPCGRIVTSDTDDGASTEATEPIATEGPVESITYTGEVTANAGAIVGFQSVVENSIVIDRTGNNFVATAAFAYTFADDGSPQCLGTTSFYFEGEATLDEGSKTLLFEGIRRIEYDWRGSCAEQQSPEPSQQIYFWELVGDAITGGFHGGDFTASP